MNVLSLEKQNYFHRIKEVKLLLILILKNGIHWVVFQCITQGKMCIVVKWTLEGQEDNRLKGSGTVGILRKENTHS